MKYLILFLMISNTCSAMMTAQKAAARANNARLKNQRRADNLFIREIDGVIQGDSAIGSCGHTFPTLAVSENTVDWEVKKLTDYGYETFVEESYQLKTDGGATRTITGINVRWCKE